jgi:hypothetical protein
VEILMEAGIEKEFGRRMEVYETPLAQVRGVFLCENVAAIVSPVRKVTLEGWEDGGTHAATAAGGDDFSLPLW